MTLAELLLVGAAWWAWANRYDISPEQERILWLFLRDSVAREKAADFKWYREFFGVFEA